MIRGVTSVISKKNLKKGEPLELNCLVSKLWFHLNIYVNYQIFHVIGVNSVTSKKNLKMGEPLEINCLVIKSLNFNFNCFCVYFQILHVTSVTSKMEMKKNSTLIHFSDVISVTSITGKKNPGKGGPWN